MSAATCPQCGTALRAAASGLCPACLLNLGLQSQSLAAASAGGTPSAAALAETLAQTSAPSTRIVERRLPEPGEQFGGYQIVRTLGKGGMGAVFEADQLETGRRVALKVLKHSLDSPDARARFLREGRLAASINHPHSVYVFGTEEIDGTPAIVMELVSGGTLQEFVKRDGPLPIGKAVDVTLQIIAGLEAAQKLGVLHRDIKPANCFVDADGSVKVGDFGLSISTGPRANADVTKTGVFLGTPAFSSPEQLRGDELNVRSDMYAVGVTLYYLLTGKTPFEADNLVKLLATVLERTPESPKNVRPEISQGLANVVLRCLQKQPGDRYKDYATLRTALQPFASEAPTAATLGLRYIAAVVDGFLLFPLILLIQFLIFRDIDWLSSAERNGGWWAVAIWSLDMGVRVGYFTLLEGLLGWSLGKHICRLKVVGRDRMPPGILLAFARAFLLLALLKSPAVLAYLFGPTGASWPLQVAAYSTWLLMLAMFTSARRANGYSGWHDLLTGTSVISTAAAGARLPIDTPDDLSEAAPNAPRIGPYHVLRPLSAGPKPEWTLAYDTRLLRRVWVRQVPAGTPEVAPAQRNLARVGRLRWLNSCRSDAENWDAYEALSGKPLVELCAQKQSWQAVRYWLLDLAEELKLAAKAGTLPEVLALDRVWITADGAAKLLDFPAPGIEMTTAEKSASPVEETSRGTLFLEEVATAALEGQPTSSEIHAPPQVPLPLHARQLLTSLPRTDLDGFLAPLRETVRQPAAVTRERRFLFLMACCLPAVFFAAMGFLGTVMIKEWRQKHPLIQPLSEHLSHLYAVELSMDYLSPAARQKNQDQADCLEVIIAYRFGDTIRDPQEWNSGYGRTIPWQQRLRGEQIVKKYPTVTQEDYDAAEANLKLVSPLVIGAVSNKASEVFLQYFMLIAVLMWLGWACFLSVAAAIVCRRGLLLRLFGIELVTASGVPASRLRLLGRSVFTWSPFFLLALVPAFILPALQAAGGEDNARPLYFIMFLYCHAWLALAVWSALRPGRGLADAICGTWPVPR